MKIKKLQLWMAGLVAFLVGMPLTEEAYGQDTSDIIDATGDLISIAIAASANGS